nr:PREDICTED: uncharacterized protein LOC105662913 isoform X2 [Megachile rotundata]
MKIYTENGEWSLRPILCPIENDMIWIVFSVHHMVRLNEIQLQYFFNHVITYRIFCGKKRFSERAKKDKVKKFYISDSSMNIEPHDFLEIYPTEMQNDNIHKKSRTPSPPEPIIVTNEVYGDLSIITYLDMIPGSKILLTRYSHFIYNLLIIISLDKAHEYKFRKMLRKNRFPPESEIELLQVAEKSMSETKIKSKAKKQLKATKKSKRKQDIEVTYEINLLAETMFSDMGTVTSFKRTPPSSNVSAVLIYTESRNILSNKQLRKNLNPIAIKLEQLSNFPTDLIIEGGFKYLHVKIFFLNHTIVTPYYIPNNTMCFEFVKCFLCREFNPEELINFLIAKLIIVKIIGVRIINVIQPTISVPKKSDKEASEKSSKTVEVATKEEVLLGIAKFNVSDLLRGLWEMRLISSVVHPCNIDFTCMNINNEKMNTWENSPLTNDILTSFDTLVKIKVRLSYGLQKMHQKILRCKNILNRIFLILNDVKLVNDILENVSFHNSTLLVTYQYADEDGEDSVVQGLKDILTGFVINSCEKFYIFLEGLSNGFLLTIWKMVADLPFENKCVYYNSSYIFLTRLYGDFVSFGGVVRIELSDPLETELRKCNLYIGETKTTVEANVMKKMGLMKFSSTIESLCQACLFPESSAVKVFLDNVLKIQLNGAINYQV